MIKNIFLHKNVNEHEVILHTAAVCYNIFRLLSHFYLMYSLIELFLVYVAQSQIDCELFKNTSPY